MTATEEPPELAEEINGAWYRPGPSIDDFHESNAFVRVLVGGRGSGKTVGVAVDASRHCWRNAGAKVIVTRKTETSQVGSTIDTFAQCFQQMGDLYSAKSHGLFRIWNDGLTFRVPSAMAVQKLKEASLTRSQSDINQWVETEGEKYCGYIEFKGLPHVSAGESKLRGMECSMMVFVEGDQIEERAFNLAFACLRWKGADRSKCDRLGFIEDRSIILDTNPPSESHWIAQMETREKQKPEVERRMKFWHISTYENESNLPPDYIKDTILLPYEFNPPMIERMLYGRYADAYEGKPVYYAYSRDRHEAQNLGWPKGATMAVGMDVGTNNASTISAYRQAGQYLYWWFLREIIQIGSDTDRQCLELLQVLANEFPMWNEGGDVCPQTLFFCDPAAKNSAFTKSGPTSSALKVMHSHGIYPGMKTAAHLQPTIAAVNRLLQQKHTTDAGRTIWHFKIDTERCPSLARAFRGGYRYPTKDEPGYGNDQPLKGSLCEHLDHVADSGRYPIINVLDIAQESHDPGMTAKDRSVRAQEPTRTI